MKNNPLFDIPEIIIPKKNQKLKPIPKEKWLIMCEKEEIINFLCLYIPYANTPIRINSGRDIGTYHVRLELEFIKAQYKNAVFTQKTIKEINDNHYDFSDLIILSKKWPHGKSDSYGKVITFTFNKFIKKQYLDEWDSIYG